MADEGAAPDAGAAAPDAGAAAPDAGAAPQDTASATGGAASPGMDSMDMLTKVRRQDGIHYRVPVTPDYFVIPGHFTAETEVYIFGLLPPSAEKLEIKFREDKTMEKVALLVCATVQPSPKVFLRTYHNKTTEEVVSEDIDVKSGSHLICRVKAYPDGSAKVTLNDKSVNYPPRDGFPLDKVLYFSMHGDFFTGSVSILKPQWPDHLHATLGHQMSAGYHITVEGSVTEGADKMQMNILRAHDVHDDVLLGIVAQFSEPRQLVRRTKQEGVWLDDQVDQDVPFEPGQPFILDVTVQEQDFQMKVNDKMLPPYHHKVFYGIGHNLCLEKNIKFKNMRVCSISHPKHWNNKPPNVKVANLLLFKAKTPAASPIPLEPNTCIYVQGMPLPHANEFKVALAKGPEESAEAALMIHVQIPQGMVFVYDGSEQNKGAGHQCKVKVNRLFACRIDAFADTFKVWINTLSNEPGAESYDVTSRFPVAEVTSVNVFGAFKDVSVIKAPHDAVSP